MNAFLQASSDNNTDAIKHILKIIALAVRTEIEGFHIKHFSDNQMKELNPLIRQGVYNALFAYANVTEIVIQRNLFITLIQQYQIIRRTPIPILLLAICF
ncbi:hypothetical protein [Mucilaginibacter polytrichastri]|uniref:hypothetical protein n=1 Tax=Mucilaginibacter polytrichastri TaxID=1302689 RepID=UPI0008EC4FCF|nr:hypothetical protein [Mucilaginibacter polytrichastri]SFS61720.1 hypothetical protein SAMN04487890_102382 [Mucilaginibacter polytrichastri]